MKSFLQKNNIEMCSTHNKGKSVAAKRFIRTLKNKMNVSKNLDKLDEIVTKYNETYHGTIEMKSVDVKSNTY